ncbi:thioesterase II family protein [Nocardia sp. CA-128927]|uniref:thioesterase II family protein n=1 Tax=Nocardia sp. CA-128927 TaxID=3239975 RepID=UPI003D998467
MTEAVDVTCPRLDSATWIRTFAPNPKAQLRLVCFPHAGGSASFFFPISTALSGLDIEVLAVQYPGRQDRRNEPPITDMGALADSVTEALQPWSADRLAFFGHSLGATLAFEVARRMASAPEILVASGRRAPSRRREEALHRSTDAEIVAELRSVGGTDAILLQDEELRAMLLPAVRADYTAIENYECDPDETVIDSPITVFVGDRDPYATLDEARAWRGHTTGQFNLHTFNGGHFYLTAAPKETITRLTEVLTPYCTSQE